MDAIREFLIKHRGILIILSAAAIACLALIYEVLKPQISLRSFFSSLVIVIGITIVIALSLWVIWVVPKKQIAALAKGQSEKTKETAKIPTEILTHADSIEALSENNAKTEVLQPKEVFELENEARKTLAQIIGGVVVIIGLAFTGMNLWITQREAEQNRKVTLEGQITDRFTKAISQLGDSKLEVRLGGIYALERLLKDSPR